MILAISAAAQQPLFPNDLARIRANAEAAVADWGTCVARATLDRALDHLSPEEAVVEGERRCQREEDAALAGIEATQRAEGSPISRDQLRTMAEQIQREARSLLIDALRRQRSEAAEPVPTV